MVGEVQGGLLVEWLCCTINFTLPDRDSCRPNEDAPKGGQLGRIEVSQRQRDQSAGNDDYLT